MIQGFSSGLLGNRELIYETDLPSFQRDFASVKTLDHGTGPAITFTRASGATYFDANGVLQTAANDVARFDHSQDGAANSLGLLIEESRTNSIRNSQAGGSTNGVIGSGGVLPTNWQVFVASGISREVVASGTSNGLAYVDLKLSGTSTESGFIQIYPESLTQTVASSGQSWAASMYLAVVAGSTSNITDPRISVVGRDSGGTLLENTNLSVTLTGALARRAIERTLTNASTVRVSTQFLGTIANGATIDITLRIAAPQLELGAFPTSYISTTSAEATRSADSAVVTPISGFYNQAEGTLFAEAQVATNRSYGGVTFRHIAQTSTTDFSASLGILVTSINGFMSEARDNSSSQAILSSGSNTGGIFKLSTAYKLNDFAFSVNGLAAVVDASGTPPTTGSVDQLGIGGVRDANALGNLNGHIRKIAYYPKRLTNALLEQLTT